MKKFLLMIVMVCVGVLQALAQDKNFDYTDKNGVTWSCYGYYDYSCYIPETGTYKMIVTINNASNYNENVIVPDTVYDEENNAYTVTNMDGVFYGDKTITKVTLPKSVTSLSSMSGTFNGCSNLSTVENTSQIETLSGNDFNGCKSITFIDLSSCKTIGSSSFSGCSNLKEVKLGKCENISYNAFQDCNNLQTINVSTVKSIESSAFDYCRSIVNVNLKNCTSIGGSAFNYCTSLAKVENTSLLTSIPQHAFSNCDKLTTIDLSNCTTIGESAFSSCSSLQNVDLSRCKSYGRYAFSGCSSLTTVNLTACKSMDEGVFMSCSKLKDIIGIENFTKIESSAFSGCNLSSVNLPVCKSIDGSAFSYCTNLKSIKLPNCSEVGSSAFSGCTSLNSVELPNCSEVGSSAFSNCTNLNSVELPNCTTVDGGAFMNCSNLETIKLPKCKKIYDGYRNEGYEKTIYSGAFAYCIKLQSFEIPNCKSLGNYTFYGCKFKKFTLSATLQNIGRLCFDNDVVLTINAETPPTVSKSNTGMEDASLLGDNVMVKVPEVSLASYKTADVWKNYANRIFPVGAVFDYDVKATAQQSTSGLADTIGKDKLSSVVTLKVSGTINSYDIMVMRNKMDNLHNLDLSDADIVANSYEYYTGCCSQDSVVGHNAFRELNKLVTVKLPNSAKSIESCAFYGCTKLQSVVLPQNLKSISNGYWMDNNGTFGGCSSLTDVEFKSCETIGGYTFYSCSALKNIVLPSNLKEIGQYAFDGCYNLETVDFPPALQTIDSYAFNGCSALKQISLPSLTRIDEYAFQGCSQLLEARVPSTLEQVGDNAFSGCNKLNDVYAYTVQPVNINQNTFCTYETATLHVPEQSFNNYYWNTEWSQFRSMEPFNEPYTFFYVNKAYTLASRFKGKPSIDVHPTGGLIVVGDEIQNADSIHIEGSAGSDMGTILADGNLKGEKLYIDITKDADRWYFFSFPFDIKRKNVKTSGDYVFRRYNGAKRATYGSNGWEELDKDDEWLHRGEGYAFQSSKGGTLTLVVEKEQLNDFVKDNAEKQLASYPADNDQNASWNFIGNPHTGYFDINDLGYDAPITYWDGTSYVAVRPGDDECMLKPMQAFFVQKPMAVSAIEFDGDKRLTKEDSEQNMMANRVRRMARGIDSQRQFVNITVADGNSADHTRIVFNNAKSIAYELDCDAAKFMSQTEVAQLYTVEAGNTRLAINERPAGSVRLGFKAPHAGEFTIAAQRMDTPMLLKDNVTGATFDLAQGDYNFTSEAGTYDDRFMLVANNSTTGISEIAGKTGVSIIGSDNGLYISGTNGKDVSVYTVGGLLMATRNVDGLLSLSKGIYVVKVDGLSTKIMVK